MSTFAKKVTSAVAGLSIVFSIVSPLAGVSAAYTSLDAANKLSTLGVIVDQSANPAAYNLGDNLLKGEGTKVMMNLSSVAVVDNCEGKFADLSASSWVCKYAETALANGMVAANTNYGANGLLTNIQALKMVFQGRDIERAENADWRAGYVETAVEMGIADAFTNYDDAVSRGQFFIWASNAIDMEEEEEISICEILDTCTEEEEEEEETVVSGDDMLEVSTSPLSPTATAVASGKDRTSIVAFEVTAGSSDVELDEVMIEYVGLSDDSGFSKIAVYNGNDKLTKQDNKTFDSDGEAELTFENDTVIQAGETITLMVTANVASSTGNVAHQLKISTLEASSDVELSVVKSVVFDVISATNTAKLDIDIDQVTSTPTLGETVTFAEFTLEEEDDNEDVIVKSLTFEFGGGVDAEDDIADLVLFANNVEIATNLEVNDDDEVVVNLDYTVEADESVDFELRGTITGSIGQTLTLTLEEVYAIGAETSIISSLTGNSLPGSLANFTGVDGSEINISFDKSDTDEAKPGAEDVVVGTLTIESVSDYTIDELTVTVDTGAGTGVTNLVKKLELDGDSNDGSILNGGTNTATYTFKDISLDAGVEQTLDLVVEFNDATTLNGEKVTFTVAIVQVEDEENDQTFTTSSSPLLNTVLSSNSFDTKSIDIETASYDLVRTTISARDLVLGNGIEIVLYKGKLSVGDADDITFKDINFTGSLFLSGTTTAVSGYDFKDILDSATLNVGGVTSDANIKAAAIEFDEDLTVAAGSDNVEVLLTAILKDNNSVTAGDTLSIVTAVSLIDAEDSEDEDLVTGAANVPVAAGNQIILNDKGTFTIKIVNNGENEEDIEDVVLAGTSGVVLAEVEIEAEEEDMKVKELTFTLTGSKDTTISNVRLMDGSTVIADGAVVTVSGGTTVVVFKDDFIIEDTGSEIDAVLVADIEVITNEGGESTASTGALAFFIANATDVEVTGVNSNDDITATTDATVSEDVLIVPVMVTVSIEDVYNEGDATAIISFTIDQGDNELDNDDVIITNIDFEAGDNAFLDITAIRNDDGTPMNVSTGATDIVLATGSGSTEVVNGDEFTLTQDTSSAVTSYRQVVIVKNGVTFTVDGSTYTIVNDKIVDLGSYKD